MIIFEETLSPRSLGTQLLGRIARERRDGMLIWEADGQERKIYFKAGRPEVVIDPTGVESQEKASVVTAVRALAATVAGHCVMRPADRELTATLGLDTLGEALVGLARGLKAEDLARVVVARKDDKVEPTPVFAKLASIVAQLVGESLAPPSASRSFGALVEGASTAQQRGYVTLLALGGLRAVASAEAADASTDEPRAAVGQAQPTGPAQGAALPADPEVRRVVIELQQTYGKLVEASHYAILGIEESATTEQVREAYFKMAKRWHSDRFAGMGVGDEVMAMVEDLFRRAGEAQKVLIDPEQRKSYDFVRERKAKGLPTDVNLILEAEALFSKAQILVRRGQAAGAEPILRKAVEMNKGEAEFWAYFGFAIHAARGKDGLVEARAALKRSLEMNPKLDVAHEFLGRIARVEGQLQEAQRELRQALDMNRKNRDAERELRLIAMRGNKAKEGEEDKKGISALLGGFLKKK
jgi:curved DNA-binding protein CbpA